MVFLLQIRKPDFALIYEFYKFAIFTYKSGGFYLKFKLFFCFAGFEYNEIQAFKDSKAQ